MDLSLQISSFLRVILKMLRSGRACTYPNSSVSSEDPLLAHRIRMVDLNP